MTWTRRAFLGTTAISILLPGTGVARQVTLIDEITPIPTGIRFYPCQRCHKVPVPLDVSNYEDVLDTGSMPKTAHWALICCGVQVYCSDLELLNKIWLQTHCEVNPRYGPVKVWHSDDPKAVVQGGRAFEKSLLDRADERLANRHTRSR